MVFDRVFLFSIVGICISLCICQEVPYLRIIAPQSVCKEDSNGTEIISLDGVTVSFQPRDGIKFSYNFRIFFKTLMEGFPQRETLLIWKAVRALEYRLNTKERLKITKENMVFIGNSEVIPGVLYIFHTYGITDAGETSKEQIFSVRYTDGGLQNQNTQEGINFILIGSEIAVASSTFILFAKLTFCNTKVETNFYLRWNFYNFSENYEAQSQIGSTLYIPHNYFVPTENAKIEALALEVNSSKVLAKGSINLNIVQRGFQTYLIPSSAKIGMNSTLLFHLVISDFDNNMESIQVSWEYFDMDTGAEIISDTYQNGTTCRLSFPKYGRYQVVAIARRNEIATKVVAEVEVTNDVFVSYDYATAPDMNPISNQSYHYSVLVMGLIEKCRAGWISVQEDGFTFISPEDIDKRYFGEIKVSDRGRYYLREISDLTDNAINEEVILHIPALDIENRHWLGLRGDTEYKFRLNVVCPLQNGDADSSSPTHSTSHFEFSFHTNSPPKDGSLMIVPKNGTAMKTIFRITATPATDILLDTPLSYELCGKFDNYRICFGKYFEYKTWNTMLPYSWPMEIFIEICDIRMACKMISGHDVLVHHTSMNLKEFELQKEKISNYFSRTDFAEGFSLIIMLSLTFKNTESNLFEDLRKFASLLTDKEIDRMLEHPHNRLFISQDKILEFVSESKKTLEILELSNTKALEKLLDIMEQLPESTNSEAEPQLPTAVQTLEIQERFKRQYSKEWPVTKWDFDKAYIHMNMQLIQDVIRSRKQQTNDEFKVIDHVDTLMQKMCFSETINSEFIETESATILVKKVSGNYLLNKDFIIRNNSNSRNFAFRIKTLSKAAISRDHEYCAAIVQYPKDYFTNDPTLLINIRIYNLRNASIIMEKHSTEMDQLLSDQDIRLDVSKTHSDENTCLLWVKDKWTSEFCQVRREDALRISCSCTNLGFFRLIHTKSTTDNAIISRPYSTKNIISFPKDTGIQSVQPTVLDHILPDISSTVFTMVALSSKTTTTTFTTTTFVSPTKFTTVDEVITKLPVHYIKNEISKIYINNTKSSAISDRNIEKASTMGYVIPLIFLCIVIFITISVLYYRRYSKKPTKCKLVSLTSELKVRQPNMNIKYATVYDQHLLNGSF